MKYKNQIIILMVILILFNILSNPIKSNAAAIPIGVTMGASAKAFLAFILASTAVGVTYSAIEDAKASFTSVSDMTNEQLADWIFGTPPPPQNQGPPDKFKWYDLLGLGLIGGAVTQQLNDFIDAFKGKFGEVQEGKNIYTTGDIIYYNGYNVYFTQHVENGINYLTLYVNGNTFNNVQSISWDYKYSTIEVNAGSIGEIDIKPYYIKNGELWRTPMVSINIQNIQPQQIIPSTTFNYYITNNAPVLNPVQNPPPEKIYIPYLPTLDPDNDKIKEVYLPTGDKRIIYDGTEDEYYTDIVNNIDLEQLQNPDLEVSSISIIDGQIVIDMPIKNPYPYPDLEPNPELPENEQNMIPWIQVVINWISQTKNSIDNIITPPKEYIPPELDFTPFSNIVILDKFPFSLPWDLKRVVETLTSNDTVAPLFEVDFPIEVSSVNWKQDVKFDIDFDRFTPLANIMRTMLSLIFVVGLVILTRRFIGGA